MTRYAGVDIGGTKRAAVLVDASGTTLATAWDEHRGAWHGRIEASVVASLESLLGPAGLQPADLDGIGIAVAGLVGRDRSTLVHSPIIRETQVELGRVLARRTGRPVTVHNDANATLYGIVRRERRGAPAGAGGTGVRLLLTLGTGLGGAAMIGDRLLVGDHGFAGELGHVTVEPGDERRCACGSRGCAEQFASGRGIEELALASPPPEASLPLLAELGIAPPLAARDVVVLAGHGDPWAVDLLATSGRMLGRAIAILCVTLDPASVMIGGSLGHAAARWILPAAEAEMRTRWAYPADRPLPSLNVDPIGPYAAATGAALLAAASAEERSDG
jgi:glucokinase